MDLKHLQNEKDKLELAIIKAIQAFQDNSNGIYPNISVDTFYECIENGIKFEKRTTRINVTIDII